MPHGDIGGSTDVQGDVEFSEIDRVRVGLYKRDG